MSIIKKLGSAIAALGVMCAMIMPVKANEQKAPESVYVWGTIENIFENKVHIKNSSDRYNNVILNITEDTVIIDAVDGDIVKLEDLKEQDSVSAYVSSVMTRSMPPMANTIVLITNIPADYRVPSYYKVKEVLETNEDFIKVIDTEGSLIATLNKDTELFGYNSEAEVQRSQIKEGSELVLWYNIVLTSFPGQTTAVKAMLLPEKLNGWQLIEGDWYFYRDNVKKINTWIPSTKDTWYYVGEDGKMVTNTVIEGYVLDENGVYHK